MDVTSPVSPTQTTTLYGAAADESSDCEDCIAIEGVGVVIIMILIFSPLLLILGHIVNDVKKHNKWP